jgi:hypothetical protein
VFYCHRQLLCGHRTAQKMKHVASGKTQGETTRSIAAVKENRSCELALKKNLHTF